MRYTLHPAEPVSDALSIATVLADHLPQTTTQTAKNLFECLTWLSIERARRLGHSPAITEATLHIPLELVAAAVGCSRSTAWRHLPQLIELGVLDHRPHKAVCRGERRNSGTVWAVRLKPGSGRKAKLSYHDLKHRWRNLDREVRAGRTSQRAMKHTKALENKLERYISLLEFSLPPQHTKSPSTPVCCKVSPLDLEAVLSVKHAPKEERGGAVDLAAKALAIALRDQSSLDWYRRLMWQLLRRYDRTGEDNFYSAYLMAQRAAVDAREGFARKPGALFVSRLKAAPWWDAVLHGPPVRVASRPVDA